MGEPRRITNKYETPRHPWQKQTIEAEKPLMQIYGLKNKKELWKAGSRLKSFKDNAKSLVARKGQQAEKERAQLLTKLKSYGLIESDALDEILGLQTEQLLNRRLQTIVHKKGLARSINQARQMITHRHILLKGKKITAPGILIKLEDEAKIEFYDGSSFNDPEHPERKQEGPSKEKIENKKESAKKEESEKKPQTKQKEEGAKTE